MLAAKKFEALQGEVPVDSRWHHPKDLHEIITLLTTGSSGEWLREYVVFSGDRGLADVVAQRDAHSHYAGSVWRFVHSLYDYARLKVAGEISENFEMYLKDDEIDGHKVSLKRYSAHESDTVRGREELRRVRTFPVPVSVDPNGSTFMEAHLRIGSGDGFSPRLYVLDNVEGDGRIYIGYIGRHPRTGKKT
ncbi:hypothetical protein [Actinomyces minihominis]|uniref:hypothetical protein n=1 Tax=Actinomyces minihominis TaxID=2002838 RepID=UPI000C08466E|nr:hypothetical protein [Actinomyces minihominis]